MKDVPKATKAFGYSSFRKTSFYAIVPQWVSRNTRRHSLPGKRTASYNQA